MATLNLVLDQRRKRKDGLYPLVFRIGHNSQTRDIGTGIKLKTSEFVKGKLTNEILNDEVQIQFLEYKMTLRKLVLKEPNISIIAIKERLLKPVQQHVTIAQFWEAEIKRIEASERNRVILNFSNSPI